MDRAGNRRGKDLTQPGPSVFAPTKRTHYAAVLVCTAIGVWIAWLGRDLWYFYDEWSFVTGRTLSLDGLLIPHNGHLSMFHASAYSVLLRMLGADAYTALRIISLLVHLSVAYGAYLVVARRRGPAWGMSALVVVGLLGTGWQNILWPFQMGMMLPVAAAMFAVHIIESRPAASWSVAALVAVGLSAAGGGIPVFVGVSLHSVVARAWRRLALLSGVGLIYGAWWMAYGESQGVGFHPRLIARYVGESAVLSSAGIGARGIRFGEVVLVAGICAVAFRFRSRFREASTLVLLSSVVIGWALTGYSRWENWEPDASRYLYVGGAYVAVLLLLWLPLPAGAGGKVLALGATLVLVLPNARVLSAESTSLTTITTRVRAELAVIDIAGGAGSPDYYPDKDLAPQLDVGSYLRAAEQYGRFGLAIDEIDGTSEENRVQMDRVASEYLGVRVEAAFVDSADARCSWRSLGRGEVLRLETHTVVVDHRANTSIGLRMFADKPGPATIKKLQGAGPTAVTASRSAGFPPWRLNVNKSVRIGVCRGPVPEG